jgi:signal transduction histidine kinase
MQQGTNNPFNPERLNAQLERANKQLLQAEKLAAIGQLAAGVAHEINNPIGYVYSNMHSLEGYLNDLFRLTDSIETATSLDSIKQLRDSIDYDFLKQDLKDLIAESSEGIDRVKTIIAAMKDFSHIGDDEFDFADVHKGINTTLKMVNNEVKYKAEIECDFGDLPEIECIPSQINQVVMNFLINAAHAIEGFGKITLRTRQEDDWVWIEIEDNGHGISPDNIRRIFEPFFTTKPVGKGTGLGLSLSFNIIEKHHGRVDVDSTPGKGTRFRIWLPVKQSLNGEIPVNNNG